MLTIQTAAQLFRRLKKHIQITKNQNFVPIPDMLAEKGFFPACAGYWPDDDSASVSKKLPANKIMVIGQDWGNEEYYEGCRLNKKGEVISSPTWRNLLRILKASMISTECCFFTNIYMGLRAGNSKMTGPFPVKRNDPFWESCRTFLEVQIEVLRPKSIITLGVHVPPFLASLSEVDLAGWKNARRFAKIDAAGPLQNAVFGKTEEIRTAVFALTHPSMWSSNIKKRDWGEAKTIKRLKEIAENI